MTPQQKLGPTGDGDRAIDVAVERVLMVVTLLLAGVLALPELVGLVRHGEVDLGAVFYPVIVGAIGVLAWTRRGGS